MRHGYTKKKLGKGTSERMAMLRNSCISLVEHKRIKTTLARAKVLRPFTEKIITIAKKFHKSPEAALHYRRNLISKFKGNELVVNKLLTEIAPYFEARNGGYLRIIKCGYRYGDASPMAFIEFVSNNVKKGK